jgi:diadenosine tetraphosphatase ApaH/serine/threonine PP2A family protein phosphatase
MQRPGALIVLIALFADIHANRQAFTACLANAHERGSEQIVLLGDYVGYGGDPDWATDKIMELTAQGALAVLGNHDNAISDPREHMNVEARVAIEWTRGVLGPAQRKFLAGLPLTIDDAARLYVHASANKPEAWSYVASTAEAADSIMATPAHITVCGHIHRPALYSMSGAAKMTAFTPTSGFAIQLMPGRRWLAVLGSVGQPRDGTPAAAYALLDTDRRELTYCRVPYDVEAAAAQIRRHGLPSRLAERLFTGE